ncbi:MAG: GNAT family N-acetyltransferase [Selenomonadaceae bacterium]|nr:GNAT family N-acetyltransferase [Selenomonadaceae bacterium]
MTVELVPTLDKENFIVNIQAAFKKAVVEEYGDDGKEVIPREDVEKSFAEEGAKVFDIVSGGEIVGGTVLKIRPNNHNELLLLYVKVDSHGKGIGAAAWQAIEKLYPETKTWETCTPYFEKRNLHFYINKCGFHAVEFFNPHHKDPHEEHPPEDDFPGGDYFFKFEKVMRQ